MKQRPVEIVESYVNYTPPFDVSRAIRALLNTVLRNTRRLSRSERRGKVWSRKRKFDKTLILGRYHQAWRGKKAWIELRVDKILNGAGKWVLRVPLLTKILLGHVLFHEVGYHIHHTVRPVYDDKEDVAEQWSGKLGKNFIRKRYWYASPIILAAFKLYLFMYRKR